MENINRAISIIKSTIQKLDLNLSGLTVVTECASGAYMFTPIIALISGAKVIAVGRDSRYGKFQENADKIKSILETHFPEFSKEISFFKDKVPARLLKSVNITTNSGGVRPITEDYIKYLNPKSVIPLMWETWEFRKDDLHIFACQKYKIPVIGTDEDYPKIDMFGYNLYITLKLLFDLGIEVHNNEIVLLGGGKTGEAIAAKFNDLKISFDWYTENGNEKVNRCFPYSKLNQILDKDVLDVVVCAEHSYHLPLVGPQMDLNFKALAEKFPTLSWGHISGNIDANELAQSNINFLPEKIMPTGYMSYETTNLGIRPVIELNTAGLKVGEIASKARLNGDDIELAIQKTIDYGIGQDFEDGFFRFRP